MSRLLLSCAVLAVACGGASKGGGGNEDVKFGDISLNTIDGNKFPTFLAHLFGQEIDGTPLRAITSLSLLNNGTTATELQLVAELQGYSYPTMQTVALAPGSTTPTIDLTLDINALYGLSSPVASTFAFSVLDNESNVLDATTRNVTVLPKNTVFWTLPNAGGQQQDVRPFISVFVTPHDKDNAVDDLLMEAAGKSNFKAMIGYQYLGKTVNDSADLAPGACTTRASYYVKSQKVSVNATATCSLCTDDNAIYYVVDQANYNLAQAGMNYQYLLGASNLGSFSGSFNAPSNGTYYHLICNPSTNSSNRAFAITRSLGADEGAKDQVAAIFNALKARGMVYVNVPQDFFDNAQNVKFPSESLATNSANCIDGTLVFASALESMGMEPGIVIVPGHAFVAVRVAPGIDNWAAIETTMVSSGAAKDAFTAAISTWLDAQEAGVDLLVDVKAMRGFGLLPAPM